MGHCLRPALVATLALLLLAAHGVRADEVGGPDLPVPLEPASDLARAYVASMEHSPELQAFLDRSVEQARAGDDALRSQILRVALIDLRPGEKARFAHVDGGEPIYPASVVKFVYLMAAYRWQEEQRLEIDGELDRELGLMIHASSNQATQRVVARLTETEPGPALQPDEYAEFVGRRHAVKRWLRSMGIEQLHAVHPTYNGGGDLYGRDVQFLKDTDVEGGVTSTSFSNRQAMTAMDTARLLALLATDQALTPEDSRVVRSRMKRDLTRQPYQRWRIAGVTEQRDDLEVYSKSGTWGPIFADAGIIRRGDHDLVLVVFLEGRPAYRGAFIANLARSSADQWLEPETRLSDRMAPSGG